MMPNPMIFNAFGQAVPMEGQYMNTPEMMQHMPPYGIISQGKFFLLTFWWSTRKCHAEYDEPAKHANDEHYAQYEPE